MEKVIYADQMLHGYENGHQLLKASCELSMNDKKKVDELSDLNGMTDNKSFVEYYTGYPLENGEKYVIAKTWYAYEMKRPGCVWTHSILFNTKDVNVAIDINMVLSIFKRPQEGLEWDYSKKISFKSEDKEYNSNFQRENLNYIVYTLFSSDKPKYIMVHAGEFVKEFFMVLNVLPYGMLKTFTFCTMSYADRKYDDMPFKYQMVAEDNKYLFLSRNRKMVMCEDIHKIEKYPYWVQCYTDALLNCNLEELNNYIALYNKENESIEFYNCMSRIFFAMCNKEMSLNEYFSVVELVLPELKMELWQQTIDLVLEEMFWDNYFEKHEYEILEMIDMGKFKLSADNEKKLAIKVIHNSPDKIYPLLKKYINGQLKELGRREIEYVIRNLKADDLKIVSKMEENICVVLIHMNGELLLSKYIWEKPKDFQRALIYACDGKVPDAILRKLLLLIIQYDSEDISMDMYNVFGDRVIEQFYKTMDKFFEIDDEKIGSWMKILLKRQSLLLNNLKAIPSKSQRLSLFLNINMHTENILYSIDKYIWENIYKDIFVGEVNKKLKVQLALKFFIVIFSSDARFSYEFVQDIVTVVYRELENNTLSFDDWRQIEYLLPEVEPCYSWDKCMRVRKAMEQKKYRF